MYRGDDAPFYYRGNKMFIILASYNICLIVGTKWYYADINQRRGLALDRMSCYEKEAYLANGKKQSNEQLDFRLID